MDYDEKIQKIINHNGNLSIIFNILYPNLECIEKNDHEMIEGLVKTLSQKPVQDKEEEIFDSKKEVI
jgi:hypothetical protein